MQIRKFHMTIDRKQQNSSDSTFKSTMEDNKINLTQWEYKDCVINLLGIVKYQNTFPNTYLVNALGR